MKYKAIIFDLDGTLLNTLDDLADAMNFVLERHSLPSQLTEKYKYFIGNGIFNLVKRALPSEVNDKSFVDQLVSAFRDEYNRRIIDKTRPYPGIPELLDTLSKRDVKMAILSNKPDAATKFITSKLLSDWNFHAVFGERAEIPKKPDPAGAIEIANSLGITPGEFLYLGDSGVDMETATAAGMYAVGALWGFRTIDELLKSGAMTTIENPLELIELFDQS